MLLASLVALALFPQQVLAVGDGKRFTRIEDAVAAAAPGARVEVHPQAGGYPRTAVLVRTPRLEFVGVGARIKLDGTGFEYSGVGRVPRAIFQIEADGVTVRNFELTGAHNSSSNGAGIRINGGNDARVLACAIHGNDMGIMSNGASDQLIESCAIFRNGSDRDPGYNHNLYLGGESVTVRSCDIWGSTTGHNLKSRAHFTRVEYCHIHHAANRELDLVEATETERPHSNAVLIGNVIEKDPNCSGNRGVIHFGQERGVRRGTLFLVNNTISTPFVSPVVDLSSPTVGLEMWNNAVFVTGQSKPTLIALSGGAEKEAVAGGGNWFAPPYDLTTFPVLAATRVLGEGSLRPDGTTALTVGARSCTIDDGEGIRQSGATTHRYTGNGIWKPSIERFLGAG